MCDSFIGAYETGPVTIATIPYIRGTSETIARILQPNSIPPKKEELKTKGIHFFWGGGGGGGNKMYYGTHVQMANCFRAPVTGLLKRIKPNQLIGMISC